jgi:hypothetical protein
MYRGGQSKPISKVTTNSTLLVCATDLFNYSLTDTQKKEAFFKASSFVGFDLSLSTRTVHLLNYCAADYWIILFSISFGASK